MRRRTALTTAPVLLVLALRTIERPGTRDNALFRIPDVRGRVVPAADLDGDGLIDVFAARGGDWYSRPFIRTAPERIEALSLRTGSTLYTLWAEPGRFVWDAGEDVDADGVPDLVVGAFEDDAAGELAGAVALVSGRDGAELHRVPGSGAHQWFGASVGFLGDVDGDGTGDYVAGAPHLDPRSAKLERPERTRFGAASVRSGSDGAELYRLEGEIGDGFGTHVAALGDLDGDGVVDFLVQHHLRSPEPVSLFSGAPGERIAELPHAGWWVGPAGHLDADGVPDLFVDRGVEDGVFRDTRVTFVSGRTLAPLFRLDYPDLWSEYGITVSVGDLDGDGHDDVALGDANFNISGPGDPGGASPWAFGLWRLSLRLTASLDSDPWCAFMRESGCALVYSGRTRELLFGAFGRPGSADGMGLAVGAFPDVSGDGRPDLLVAEGWDTYVFAGPGKR